MIEGDREIDPAEASDERYGETLLYDLSKFLTSLALLAVGGVLTIADSTHGRGIKPFALIIVTSVLFLSLVLSASTASTIAIYRYSGRPMKPKLHYYIWVTFGLLGMGLGMFTFMWIDKIT